MLWVVQSHSPHLDAWYSCCGFAGKALLSIIVWIIKVHLWNGTNLASLNNLHSFCYGHCNHVLINGIHDIDALDLQEMLFSTIFLKIKVHSWNETNLDSRNNLYSFCYWHCNHVPHIWLRGLDALDLQEKLYFPPFSL